MIYISAGHNPKGPNPDPGAIGVNGVREADLTVELRNLISAELDAKGIRHVTDRDNERLADYLKRIEPGTGSVVCEIHFNASVSPAATGVETIVPARADANELALATKLSGIINKHTGLLRRGKNGVISEADSHRGSLALMREQGINVLLEVCYITNRNDLAAYRRGITDIARDVAAALISADALIA